MLAVTIDGHLCLGKVAERVFQNLAQCCYIEKKNGLTFLQEIIRDIPPDSVLEIITPSLCFEADDDYSRLTSLLQTDTITVTEKIHELFEQEETVIMSCQKTRRGHIVNKQTFTRFLLRMNKTFVLPFFHREIYFSGVRKEKRGGRKEKTVLPLQCVCLLF